MASVVISGSDLKEQQITLCCDQPPSSKMGPLGTQGKKPLYRVALHSLLAQFKLHALGNYSGCLEQPKERNEEECMGQLRSALCGKRLTPMPGATSPLVLLVIFG